MSEETLEFTIGRDQEGRSDVSVWKNNHLIDKHFLGEEGTFYDRCRIAYAWIKEHYPEAKEFSYD